MVDVAVRAALGRARYFTLARTCAYAHDVAVNGGRSAAPLISFAALAGPAAALAGDDRLGGAAAHDLGDMIAAVAGLPALDAAALDADGVDNLARALTGLVRAGNWSDHKLASTVLTRSVDWALRLWAIQEVAGVHGIETVTEGVVPVWATTSAGGLGTAFGLGGALGELIMRRSRSGGTTIAGSLAATRACRVWLTQGNVFVTRHEGALQATPGALVYDTLARADVLHVEPVAYRMTAAPQLRMEFVDGSNARWLYTNKPHVKDVLMSSLNP